MNIGSVMFNLSQVVRFQPTVIAYRKYNRYKGVGGVVNRFWQAAGGQTEKRVALNGGFEDGWLSPAKFSIW